MIFYEFVAIRYTFDQFTSEFMNVGILLFNPEDRTLLYHIPKLYGRISRAFPSFDGTHHSKTIAELIRQIDVTQKQIKAPLFNQDLDLEAIVPRILPVDASILSFSPVYSGVADDLQEEINRIFYQFVGRFQEKVVKTRIDDKKVLSNYLQKLDSVKVRTHLQPKTISDPSNRISYNFPFAFKNAKWHTLAPQSFDYADEDSIDHNVFRWLGVGTALAANPEMGTLYLLCGKPTNPKHMDTYRNGIALLREKFADDDSVDAQVVDEATAQEWSQDFSELVISHTEDVSL